MKWKTSVPGDRTNQRVEFADQLRRLLESRVHPSVTNGQFASEAGLSPSTLSAAVSGRTLPTTDVLRAILGHAGVSGDELKEWLRTRDAIVSNQGTSTTGAVGIAAVEDIRMLVDTKRRLWDEAEPGDPDYRVNSRTLTRDELLLCFRVALEGNLDSRELAYLLASAVYWGHRYLRWLELTQYSPEAAEVLVDHVLGPFRRPRWRAAWLLQRFPEPLRGQSVDLIRDFWTTSIPADELARLSPMLPAISEGSVENLVREARDADLARDDAGRSLLNEFVFELSKPGARGRLSNSTGGLEDRPRSKG